MTTQRIRAKSIYPGFEWRLRITLTGADLFSPDTEFVAQIRRSPELPPVATLTTNNGGIVTTGIKELELAIPAATSQGWAEGTVLIDVVRIWPVPITHLGFRLTVPVQFSITRDIADEL